MKDTVKLKGKCDMENKEKFVKIPMKMFAYESVNYVKNDEIAVYYEIVYHASARNVSVSFVTVELLYSRLKWDFKSPSRGKKRILSAILSLQEKGYISLATVDEINNNTYLVIHTPKNNSLIFTEKIRSGSSVYTGWTPITEKKMNILKEDINNVGQRLKILTYIIWRFNIGYAISYEEWANVLKISESTAKRVIKSLREEKIINIESGVYYSDHFGKIRQEINKYEVNENVEEDEYKTTILRKIRRVDEIANLLAKTTDERVKSGKYNLFKYGENLTIEDMHIYMTTQCPIVKEWGEKRFTAISKNSVGKVMVDSWRSEVERELVLGSDITAIYDNEEILKITNSDDNEYEEINSGKYQEIKERLHEQEKIKRKEADEKFKKEMSELPDEEELEEDEEIAYKVALLEENKLISGEEHKKREEERFEKLMEKIKKNTGYYDVNEDEFEFDSLPFT